MPSAVNVLEICVAPIAGMETLFFLRLLCLFEAVLFYCQ